MYFPPAAQSMESVLVKEKWRLAWRAHRLEGPRAESPTGARLVSLHFLPRCLLSEHCWSHTCSLCPQVSLPSSSWHNLEWLCTVKVRSILRNFWQSESATHWVLHHCCSVWSSGSDFVQRVTVQCIFPNELFYLYDGSTVSSPGKWKLKWLVRGNTFAFTITPVRKSPNEQCCSKMCKWLHNHDNLIQNTFWMVLQREKTTHYTML